MTDISRNDDPVAAYWKGYAAGLADREAQPNPRGWIFLCFVALCILVWTFTIAVVVLLFDLPAGGSDLPLSLHPEGQADRRLY